MATTEKFALDDRHMGLFLGLCGVMVFSLSLPASRVAVAELPVIFVTSCRLAGAGLIAASWLAARGRWFPARRHWRLLAGVVLGVVVGFPLFSALAMSSVDASHGGVVLAILPLLTAIMGMLLGGERPSSRFWLYAVGGALTVLAYVLSRSRGVAELADLHLLVAALGAAVGYACGGRLAREMPGLDVIATALVVALPVSLLLVPLSWPEDALEAGPAAWGAVLFTAIGPQFLAFYFFYRGLALGGIAKVGQVQLLQVYFTLGFSAVLLGERIEPLAVLTACLAVLFVWLGRRAAVG